MEVFDKDGNPVENVFSQEEVDAKIAEAKSQVTPPAPVAEPKKEDVQPSATPEVNLADVVASITSLQETVSSIVKSNETTGISKFTASLDEEKKATFQTQFEALQKTGMYENTPEGIEKRASVAYTIATGEAFDAGNFDMGNLSAASGKAPTKPNAEMSEVDKQLSEVLGNTEEDFKKHADNPTS